MAGTTYIDNGGVVQIEFKSGGKAYVSTGPVSNALYAFLDQGARDVAAKQAADAKKRGGDVKY